LLNFIGCGSALNTQLGNNGAFIKKDNILFMIDCGSCTFERIQKSNLLEGIEHIYILLTHTHPDHIGSLGDLIFYSYFLMGKVAEPILTVIAHNDVNFRDVLRGMHVGAETYDVIRIEKNESIDNGNFHVELESVPVTHMKGMNCFGFVIEYENQTIYYSGDANDIPVDILNRLHNGEFNLFYQDTSKSDFEGNPHLSLRRLTELVNNEVRNKVFCMHLDKEFKREEAIELGFNVVSSITSSENYLIDDYSKIIEKLGGEKITINPENHKTINPFDIDLLNEDDRSEAFVSSLENMYEFIETLHGFVLTQEEKDELYRVFMKVNNATHQIQLEDIYKVFLDRKTKGIKAYQD